MGRGQKERERESEREEERRKRNLARAERPEQTLSRAFSIMQIESDWLRSGFSTALLSFRASEFSPRYLRLLPSTLFSLSLSLFLSFSLSFSLLFVSLCFSRCVLSCPCWTSGTNERRAYRESFPSGIPSLSAILPAELFARREPAAAELLKSFDGPSDSEGYMSIHVYIHIRTYI